jgi:histone acetyltransferase 1
MLLFHERFLEEGFGSSLQGADSETSRARKSGRADHESEILSLDRTTAVSEVMDQGKLGPPANKAWVDRWRKDLKIAGVCGLTPLLLSWSNQRLQRQFNRLIEMLILLRLDPRDRPKMRAYRLQVKERLFRFNFVCHLYFVS